MKIARRLFSKRALAIAVLGVCVASSARALSVYANLSTVEEGATISVDIFVDLTAEDASLDAYQFTLSGLTISGLTATDANSFVALNSFSSSASAGGSVVHVATVNVTGGIAGEALSISSDSDIQYILNNPPPGDPNQGYRWASYSGALVTTAVPEPGMALLMKIGVAIPLLISYRNRNLIPPS